MEHVVEAAQIPEQAVISIRARIAQAEIPAFMARSFEALFGYLGTHGAEPIGPPLAIYHAFEPHDIDTEVCVPVEGSMTPGGDLTWRILPAATVARTVHVGPYQGLVSAYAALTDWIRDENWHEDGPVQERYLTGPGDGGTAAGYRTEVEIPIKRALVGAHR